MYELILPIVALPFISAIALQLMADRLGRSAALISVSVAWITLVLAALATWSAITGGGEVREIALQDGWGILRFDSLGVLMCLVISAISLVVRIYSLRYMIEEPGYVRFFTLLDLMSGTLYLLVLSGDLITLLIAWHLISVWLYFLLGHDTQSQSAWRYAFWTWITYRIGDVPLVIAAILLYQAYGSWSLNTIFEGLANQEHLETVLSLPLPEVVGGLIALSAFARSAQFLLHTWLPYSMAGPTPVSALMHAGIVNAGGFLINRFAPVFVETSLVLHWVFIVGLITAVIGSLLMLVQNDIKKALGYSTMGQMGFMVMECGLGAFSLAVFHLIAHGLFKGTLFLSAGDVIGKARQNDGVPRDQLYSYIVEKNPVKNRMPWLLMALLTLLLPVTILLLAHWIVSEDFYQKQGAIVLLFFGWVTGAQLIFVTYRMRSQNLWRLFSLTVGSFVVVIVGYILISHVFDLYLYPDEEFRKRIYEAASIDLLWFSILIGIVTLVIVSGWLRTYYIERNAGRQMGKAVASRKTMYALIANEFYINTFYTYISRKMERFALQINAWLRWL